MPDDTNDHPATGTDMTLYQEPAAPRETTPMAKMLKLYLASRDIEQKDLAAEIGISPSTLGNIERGKAVGLNTALKLLVWLFPEGSAAGPPSS